MRRISGRNSDKASVGIFIPLEVFNFRRLAVFVCQEDLSAVGKQIAPGLHNILSSNLTSSGQGVGTSAVITALIFAGRMLSRRQSGVPTNMGFPSGSHLVVDECFCEDTHHGEVHGPRSFH